MTVLRSKGCRTNRADLKVRVVDAHHGQATVGALVVDDLPEEPDHTALS
jgi:hypothetical protein